MCWRQCHWLIERSWEMGEGWSMIGMLWQATGTGTCELCWITVCRETKSNNNIKSGLSIKMYDDNSEAKGNP